MTIGALFPGAGTLLNVATVLAGGGMGLLLGHRLPDRVRSAVTDALGLATLLIAGLTATAVLEADLIAAVGPSAPALIVLGSLVVGGVIGAALRIEDRVAALGGVLQRRLRAGGDSERFAQGFLTASLVFCVGPLTILGALSDGLGLGIEQLALKSALDGFAAVAFAATLGVGVLASAITVAVVQGSLTVVGLLLGEVLPAAHVMGLTATGGVLLVGVAFRLLDLRQVPVGDLLPALVVAPVLVEVVTRLR